MMRFIFWLAILALGAIGIAWLFTMNHGHVILYWNVYRIDLSMNLFLVLGFVSFWLIFYVFNLFLTLVELPNRAKHYRATQVELRSYQELKNAIEHLFAGRYAKSLKSAKLGTHFKETAPVAMMLAASANHHLKQYEERDRLLEGITQPNHQTAQAILKAQMLIEEHRASEALDVLNHLQQGGARQFVAQSLAMRAHQLLGQWPQMLKIANNLSKKSYLPPLIASARIHEALTQWVRSGNYSSEELLKQWRDFASEGQNNPLWVKLFAKGFIAAGDFKMAKKILEDALEQGAVEELLALYPECGIPEQAVQLRLPMMEKVEAWLKKEPAHPSLHLALGILCQVEKLWGKSLVSFQKVLDSPRSSKSMRLIAEMGMMHIYDTLEDQEKSAVHQKEALRLFALLHPQINAV